MPSVSIIGTRGYPSYYGGFETCVRKLAPYLADDGWTVTVYGRPGDVKLDDPDRDRRIHSVMTPGVKSKSLSTLSFGLTATLHALMNKPDVVLFMNVANGFFMPLLRLKRIPIAINVDGIEWDREKWGKLAKWTFHMGACLSARFATTIICDSTVISRKWKTEFKRENEYIPYGGDFIDEILPIEPGLTHRGYALMVARFVPENTIGPFFDAIPQIVQTHPVVIVGSSGYGNELDDRAQVLSDSNPNIRWFGHLSDDRRLQSLWQHCGAYFHGHSVGGTNPALVQAMALGAPVVARDTVYNREVLEDSGLFVSPDPNVIANEITALLDSPSLGGELSSRALQRAHEHYSWAGVNQRYAETLLRLATSIH